MPDIDIDTPNGTIEAVLEIPAGKGPWPSVVLIHDLTFRQDMREYARKLADNGYLALAPNLFSRGGALRCITQVMLDLHRGSGRALDDISSARQFLQQHPSCTGTTGIIGFCLGGGFALVTANRGFDASAPFYPSLFRRDYDDVLEGTCPMVASFGGRDPLLKGAGDKLEKALTRSGVVHDVKTYERAGHGFANKYPGDQLVRFTGFGYHAEESCDAWNRVFDFFHTHLGAS